MGTLKMLNIFFVLFGWSSAFSLFYTTMEPETVPTVCACFEILPGTTTAVTTEDPTTTTTQVSTMTNPTTTTTTSTTTTTATSKATSTTTTTSPTEPEGFLES